MDNITGYSSRTKYRKIRKLVEEMMSSVDEDNHTLTDREVEDGDLCMRAFQSLPAMENKSSSDDDCSVETVACAEKDDINLSSNLHNEQYKDQKASLDYLAHETCASPSNQISDDSSDDESSTEFDFNQALAEWAISCNISHSAMSKLLRLLQRANLNVPRDPRTLLATPKICKIKHIEGGSYYHFGVANSILCKLNYCLPDLSKINSLTLHINMDGLPLFKDSNVNLWPILGRIIEVSDSDPFVIGVYSGYLKPSLQEYLNDFVADMKTISRDGLEYNDKHFSVKLDAFICDAPARAMIKCIKGHSGYSACERCTQAGIYMGRMTFPEINAPRRTDVEFDEMKDEEHHIGTSPLKELGIGFVSQFVLDYMHLVCLGVVRKLVSLWIKGPLKCRMSSHVISDISSSLISIRYMLPREFVRKPRSLSEFRLWKATEFRQFLLYTGPVVLCGKIPNHMYRHFLLLSVSIRLVLSESLCLKYSNYTKDLLVVFVKNMSAIYGKEMLVYNVHNLIHLVEDVQKYGALDNVSCFPYENLLGKLKKMVRRPQNPIAQIVNRISETQGLNLSKLSVNGIVRDPHRSPHLSGPLLRGYESHRQYKKYIGENIFISCSDGNNCFEIDGKIVVVKNILVSPSEKTFILYSEFQKVEFFFKYPLNSTELGIKLVSRVSENYQVAEVFRFCKKMVLLPFKQKFVTLPLLHKY